MEAAFLHVQQALAIVLSIKSNETKSSHEASKMEISTGKSGNKQQAVTNLNDDARLSGFVLFLLILNYYIVT